MNSRHNIPPSEFSQGRRPDKPPEPIRHPADSARVARVRSSPGKLGSFMSSVRSWLEEPGLLARMRSWLSETDRLGWVRSSLPALSPLAFARYLVAFFIGVVAAVAWQSSGSETKVKLLATPPATLAPGDLDLMRQSVDHLAVEIAGIRTTEQDILKRISALQQSAVTPVRNPARQPPSAR
jgi:hypothetical protein